MKLIKIINSYIGVLTYLTNILCKMEKFNNVSFEESSLLGSEHGEHLLGYPIRIYISP